MDGFIASKSIVAFDHDEGFIFSGIDLVSQIKVPVSLAPQQLAEPQLSPLPTNAQVIKTRKVSNFLTVFTT